jgi:hypothetical protein
MMRGFHRHPVLAMIAHQDRIWCLSGSKTSDSKVGQQATTTNPHFTKTVCIPLNCIRVWIAIGILLRKDSARSPKKFCFSFRETPIRWLSLSRRWH